MLTQPHQMVIRADAGPRVGTGHVMRCLALSQAWNRLGGKTTFVCGDIPGGLAHRIVQGGNELFTIRGGCDADDAAETRKLATEKRADWLLLDGYAFDDQYQSRVQNESTRTAVCDDCCHASHHHANLLLNPNVYADASQYPSVRDEDSMLLGPQFLLLRDEFQEPTQASIRKPIVTLARRILITFGGADPDNWSLRTLKAIANLNRPSLIIDVVAGAAFPFQRELQDFKQESGLNIRIHRNVDRMSLLYNRVDFAITAGGTTCYELARCGVPMVVLATAENQRNVARRLGELGIGRSFVDTEQLDEKQFERCLRRMIRDAAGRRDMSLRGRTLVDGMGSHRTARFLLSRLFQLRPATSTDADRLYQWRNEPAVQAASFSPAPANLSAHRDWLTRKLRDPVSHIFIIQDARGSAVGQVRLDATEDPTGALISICLDPDCRGRGLGTAMIEKATRIAMGRLGYRSVLAQIKPENHASLLAFQKADFKPIVGTTVNGQRAFQMQFEHPHPLTAPESMTELKRNIA